MSGTPNGHRGAGVDPSDEETGYLLRSPANARRLESALTSAQESPAIPPTPSSPKGASMEHRSALTLKTGDVISIPGLGTKMIGAVHQIRDNRFQIRLDQKFVESVTIDVVVNDGEPRSPEPRGA